MTTRVLLDGAAVDHDGWSQSRALHYGDGVFRTLRVHGGVCLDWPGQRAHLLADAARLGLNPAADIRAAIDDEATRLAQAGGEAVLKIMLWRRGEQRGYAPTSDAVVRLLQCSPLPRHPAHCWAEGIDVIDSDVVLATPHALAGIKHLNRLEQVLASRNWPATVHEALLCDGDGNAICGTRSNLFWIADDRLFTPRLDRCGVAGRMRARAMALAAGQGLVVEELRAPRPMLERATEIFVTNSLVGILPVRKLGARMIGAGEKTRRLMHDLAHPEMS